MHTPPHLYVTNCECRYRTIMCQFGATCSRPVCFFAHHASQLRNTGIPGGPQPVVAPAYPLEDQIDPETMATDQLLLASIGDVTLQQQLQTAGLGLSNLSAHTKDALCGATDVSSVTPLMSHRLTTGTLGDDNSSFWSNTAGASFPSIAQQTTGYPCNDLPPGASFLIPDAQCLGVSIPLVKPTYATAPTSGQISSAPVQHKQVPSKSMNMNGQLVSVRSDPLPAAISDRNLLNSQPKQQQQLYNDVSMTTRASLQNCITDDPEAMALLDALVKRLSVTRSGTHTPGLPGSASMSRANSASSELTQVSLLGDASNLMAVDGHAMNKMHAWSGSTSPADSDVDDGPDASFSSLDTLAAAAHGMPYPDHLSTQALPISPLQSPQLPALAYNGNYHPGAKDTMALQGCLAFYKEAGAPYYMIDQGGHSAAQNLPELYGSRGAVYVGAPRYAPMSTAVMRQQNHTHPDRGCGLTHGNMIQLMDVVNLY